MLATKRNE